VYLACKSRASEFLPEEIYLIVADHVSSLLFALTEVSKRYLLNEGIDEKSFFITGNTIVDAVYQHREISQRYSKILVDMGLSNRNGNILADLFLQRMS
jgi:UDP-N-acetylglucosamine 2-epimerase (non-hydrolysing)